MHITLNGVEVPLNPSVETLSDLLTYYNISSKTVIVEKNGEIFKNGQFDSCIREADSIEILHFVGGGEHQK